MKQFVERLNEIDHGLLLLIAIVIVLLFAIGAGVTYNYYHDKAMFENGYEECLEPGISGKFLKKAK